MERSHFCIWWVRGVFSLLVIFTLSFMAAVPVQSQSVQDDWQLIGQFGGSTQAVAVMRQTALVGIGLRVLAVDISEPSEPKVLGMSEVFSDTIQDIVIAGNTAYIAAGNAGLTIIDFKDPSQLKTIGSWHSSGYAEGVAVLGNNVYLANGDLGLSIIDVSNPAKPEGIGSAYSNYYAFDVVPFRTFAYIAGGDAGLLVVDAKDPNNPLEVTQLDTYGYAYEVATYGKMVYVADAWEGVVMVDISDAAHPLQSGILSTSGWSLGVSVSRSHLVSSNGAQGFDLFDVSDPLQAVKESSYLKELSDGDAMVRRAVVTGDLVLAADTLNGLRLVDISRPDTPVQKGLYGQLSYARRLSIDGDYAYVATASEGAMYAINISDPLRPYQVSKFQADGIAVDVVVTGDYATLGTFEDSSNCYTLVDISDPADPQEAGGISVQSETCGAPRQMVTKDNYIYSADEWGLRIYKLTNDNKLSQTGEIELQQEGDQTLALSIVEDYVYVADAGTGLKIIDVSDPSDPKLVDIYQPGEVVGSVVSSDNILFIGHYGEGITAADISQSGNMPVALGSYKTLGSVEEAAISGNILAVSEGSGGIEILDASDPAHIQFVQAVETPGFAWASVISDKYLYVADGYAGLLIYQKGPVEPSDSGNTGSTRYPALVVNSLDKDYGSDAPRFDPNVTKVTSSKVCTVTTAADSTGPGSLRSCLGSATAGQTILFDTSVFPPQSPVTIALKSELPPVECGSVTIDASNAGVILDGGQQVSVGLAVYSSYNTIMGLQFINFTMDGLTLEFPGEYNQIGGDRTIGDGPSGQGNVFSGCQNGIRVLFTRYNTILGNLVGTNAAGTRAAAPNSMGIALSSYATYNYIGGASVGEKNVISNNDRGLDIAANSASYNVVAGNYVGTDITGTKAIPNTSWGILIEVGGRNNIIGGTTPEERNIISGNNMGVSISDYASTQNSFIGNYIGVDVTGKKALSNQFGAGIFQSAYNRIGGTRPGEANVISANTGSGINLFGLGPVHAIVMGNIIGLDAESLNPLGNNLGLVVDGGSHSFVGGNSVGAGNWFSDNNISIQLTNAGTNHNWLSGNLINDSHQIAVLIGNHANDNALLQNTLSNSDRGIVISQAHGITLHANAISEINLQSIELEDGGNLALEAPILDEVSASGVSGSACPNCMVELFSGDEDQSLIYEGAALSDATGSFSFTGELTGPYISATATDPNGNTSALSVSSLIE